MSELPTFEKLQQRVKELEKEHFRLKKEAEKLREREEKYRSFFLDAPLPYLCLDENGLILEVNSPWLKTFGYQRREVVGKCLADFLHPNWQAHFNRNIEEIKSVGSSSIPQVKLRHREGHHLDISFEGCLGNRPRRSTNEIHCILKELTGQNFEEDIDLTQYTINQVNDCIFWINEEGKFSSVNDATCKRLGYSREELLSMAVSEIDPFFPLKNWLEQWPDFLENGFLTFESVHCSKSGGMFPVEVTINSLNYKGEQYNCAIARDISKRVRIAEELNQFKYVLDNTLDMIYMFDVETLQYVYFNRGALESLLYTKEELLQLHPYDINPHYSEQVYRQIINPLLNGDQEVLHYETIHRCKNGRDFPVEVSLQLIYSPNGIRRFVAIVRDISERKQIETALVKAKREWEMTFDAIPDIITIQDRDMRIIRANRKAHEIFQAKLGSLSGKHCYEVFRGTGEPCPECPALSTIRDSTFHRENVTHKNLGKIFNVTSSSISDENGEVKQVVNIVKDITEYKKLEAQLLQEQKIESIGSLAGGIAHDFNNILMGLFGNISLARLELGSDHPASETLGEAEKSMDRATRLTNQLLTFARGGEPVKSEVRLDRLVRDNVNLDLSGSNVEPLYTMADDLWYAEVDQGQIEQVFSNLTHNACQAMTGGGRLFIAMDNTEITGKEAISLSPGRYIRVIVEDEGEGIDPQNLERIFDPYFTTRQNGRGLGLATVYSIVNKHGGHISTTSEPGRGTTFVLYLPASDIRQFSASSPDQDTAPPVEGNPRILVMDDDDMVRSVSEKLLGRHGFSVETAADGKEAIEKYDQAMAEGEKFDIVLMDLTVPGGMGGKEAVMELLEIDPEVRAVISSGYAEDPVMANYAEYGFKDVVEKPFKLKHLLDVAHRVLKKT